MKLKIIFTALIIFCFTQFASPNRNAADGKCTCPLGKYQPGMKSKCTVPQVKESAEIVPMAGMIYWL